MVQVSKNFFSRSVVLGDTYVGNLGQNGPPAVLFRKTDLVFGKGGFQAMVFLLFFGGGKLSR